MKLLELSALCLRCDVGTLLTNDGIWAIFETNMTISSQERDSGKFSLLGSTADNTLAHIVLVVFSRAHDSVDRRGGSGTKDEEVGRHTEHST